ncbi:GntR family transcriptional regulator [Microbacterium sp. STN6]|nr:GntR family transcriptional regulator [Microbacterium sp. STN6]
MVLQSIERTLLDGTLRPGDHLPPERQLAADLGVGRSSVREAVRVLEVLGLVRTATGSGPSAGAIIVSTPSGGMSALMRLQVAAQGFRVTDVVKTRLLLETSVVAELARTAAGLAESATADPESTRSATAESATAESATAESATALPAVSSRGNALAASRHLLDAMDSPGLTVPEFLALDAQFHVSLAEASGNEVVAAMMAGLRDSIERYVQEGAATLPSWAQTSARLRAEHHAILAAIDEGDPAAASTRVHEHITGYYAESALTDRPDPTLTDPLTTEHRPHAH